MSNNIIYGLIDPNTKELRYVGKTVNLSNRMAGHYTPAKLRQKTHKNDWLKSLINKGQKAEVIVLETYDDANDLYDAEQELIAYYKFIGCNLTNSTDGGPGPLGYKHSEETKQKFSGENHPLFGKKASKETRNKMALSKLGRKLSQETKQKIGIKSRGRKHSEEIKEKNRQWHLGKIPPNRKLTTDQVVYIRSMKGVVSCILLAKQYNVSKPVILNIWSNKTYVS